MTDTDRESELRRLAERQGVLLRKADQDLTGSPGDGRYQLVDPGSNVPINGDRPDEFTLTLDDVEALLTADEATPQASVEASPHRARRASADSDPENREQS